MAPRRLIAPLVRPLLLALAFGLIGGAAAAQSARDLPAESDAALRARLKPGIKGADDRRAVDAFSWPWSAIGRVNRSDGAFCTGSLIGRAEVLTAAHCLWNTRTGAWMPASGLTFAAGYQRGDWRSFSAVTTIRRAPGSRPGETTGDWAVLGLETPLGLSEGWLGTQAIAAAPAGLIQVGYGFDHRHIQTANLGCALTGALANGTVLHDCDVVQGDSGSPILAWTTAGPMVVALHVSSATLASGKAVGLAVPIAAITDKAYPPGRGTRPLDALAAKTLERLVASLAGQPVQPVDSTQRRTAATSPKAASDPP
ncbi:peptidase S1 and S6, chymotrypsin/Hap [Rhodospirillum rubrum F11]|uniref:trypsin-like serine peptidase n=2 Tax=Rhodospirillum rubrum TaxID=1085 RepID=UPI000037AB8C|nr:trypsin-like serine protease [Rhodospirillum rubrum]AEO47046.1 peptidase S1 and S6, chymotrypsin/Hap [Rhodospirillum rubrum F11]QXG81044.1 trypsin-like serine protease [Rhodospirillum rubrum]